MEVRNNPQAHHLHLGGAKETVSEEIQKRDNSQSAQQTDYIPPLSHKDQRREMVFQNMLKSQDHPSQKYISSTQIKHRKSISENQRLIKEDIQYQTHSKAHIKSLQNIEINALSPSDEASMEIIKPEIVITDPENIEVEVEQRGKKDSYNHYQFIDQLTILQAYKKVNHFVGLSSLRVYQILLIVGNFIYKFFWISFVYGYIEQQQGTATGYNINLIEDNDSVEKGVVIVSITVFLLQVVLQVISDTYAIKRLRNQQNIKPCSLIGLQISLVCELIGFLLMQYYMWNSDTIYKVIGVAIFSQTFIMQGYYISKYKKIYQKIHHCESNLQINPLLLQF